ncbi:uncharacterized protein L201_001055 [Kwoniella dendrophila CBS 6074]|uniref:WSC domain-containing protein n=1 Tax=Kwoniella dendrophila CBS 6074 TaxID=1295534 RepID=A0AAX4JL83_9TREE
MLLVNVSLSLSFSPSIYAIITNSHNKPTSPQFAGCINRRTFDSIANKDDYGLLTGQKDNEACIELCGNKKYVYSYYHEQSSKCYCSKISGDYVEPDQIENGCDNLGNCNPCQAIVTFLQSPLNFTSCSTSHLTGEAFLEFKSDNLDQCLSICSTDVYDTEVVGFQSSFDKKQNKWEWKCSCFSGKNQGSIPIISSNKNVKSKKVNKCGKDSVWRYQVPNSIY